MEHPGHRIRHQFIEPLGVNANQLAVGLGVNRSTIGRLLAGQHDISPAMAARLGAYFAVPARWFLLMQAEYDAANVAANHSLAEHVTPLVIDADWLLTPNGAMSLAAPIEKNPTATVRTVQLDNGAIALLSKAS
jgi:addiction module HigA family antidote